MAVHIALARAGSEQFPGIAEDQPILVEQLVTVLAGIVVAQICAKHPSAQRLAVLEADKVLRVDVLQLTAPQPALAGWVAVLRPSI